KPLTLGDAHEVRRVPELAGLRGKRLDEMGMAVAEGIDRDACAEIEISLAASRHEPRALAFLEFVLGTRIGLQKRRSHVFRLRDETPARCRTPQIGRAHV